MVCVPLEEYEQNVLVNCETVDVADSHRAFVADHLV